jgi:hypothetical protein
MHGETVKFTSVQDMLKTNRNKWMCMESSMSSLNGITVPMWSMVNESQKLFGQCGTTSTKNHNTYIRKNMGSFEMWAVERCR